MIDFPLDYIISGGCILLSLHNLNQEIYQVLLIKVFFAKEPLVAICIYEVSKLALLQKIITPVVVVDETQFGLKSLV